MIINQAHEKPIIGSRVYVSPGVIITGSVQIGDDSSIWFNSVIRGDANSIIIGSRTNIQDLCVIHASHQKDDIPDSGQPTIIGNGVSVGHRVIIHAATIEDCCLIGMGAIVMDRAVIRKESIVAAGSLVTKGKTFPERSLIMGSPAKFIKQLTDDEIKSIYANAQSYLDYKKLYE